MRVAAAVLAGGAGRRMGGVDKASLVVGGVPLLDRVLAAARALCDRVIVVGPGPGPGRILEPEPGGGPVPAVQAALGHAGDATVLLVLACDLPFLTAEHLGPLLAAPDAAAAGPTGPNPLLAAYRRQPLAERASRLGPGDPASRLLPPGITTLDLGPAATFNVNRPEDLDAANLLAEHAGPVIATAQWLRELVAATVPDVTERIDPGGHGFGYHHPRAGSFCAVFPRAADVKLSFEHGALLPDPRRLLRGTGRQVRHVDVRAPGNPPADHLGELLDAALNGPHRSGCR